MIVVDSSVLVAIVKEEPGYDQLGSTMTGEAALIGAPTLVETKLVLSGGVTGRAGDALLNGLVQQGTLRVIEFTPEMAETAVAAFRRFGKGQGHPAQLNYGDCLSYAVAKTLGLPLLYKGDDFARTDIVPALAS